MPTATRVVELIKEKARVGYRSSEHMARRDAWIRITSDGKSLNVDFRKEISKLVATEVDPVDIAISEIANIKVKNIVEGHTTARILSVVMRKHKRELIDRGPLVGRHIEEVKCACGRVFQPDEEDLYCTNIIGKDTASETVCGKPRPAVHHSFQFNGDLIRDTWDHGLRSLLHKERGFMPDPEQDRDEDEEETDYVRINKIALKRPDDSRGVLVNIALSLTTNKEEYLEIPQDHASPADCKRITQEFVEKVKISPTHTTSLYRFVRSVTSRSLLEYEALRIIAEIDRCNIEHILQEPENVDKNVDEKRVLKDQAETNLDKLMQNIPHRLGHAGPAAKLVRDMLMRNVEKLKLINSNRR